MTRENEIEYNLRREREELHRSIGATLIDIEAAHLELATLYAAKATAVETDPD